MKGSRGAQGQGGPAWSGDSAHPLAPGSQGQDCKRLCKPEGKCRYCFPGRREAGWWHFALSVGKKGDFQDAESQKCTCSFLDTTGVCEESKGRTKQDGPFMGEGLGVRKRW